MSRLCTVYEDRPTVCRLYPITPGDIRDRNLVLTKRPCGFQFTESPELVPAPIQFDRKRKLEE